MRYPREIEGDGVKVAVSGEAVTVVAESSIDDIQKFASGAFDLRDGDAAVKPKPYVHEIFEIVNGQRVRVGLHHLDDPFIYMMVHVCQKAPLRYRLRVAWAVFRGRYAIECNIRGTSHDVYRKVMALTFDGPTDPAALLPAIPDLAAPTA